LLRGNPIELLELETNGRIPLTVREYDHVVIADREPNSRRLSDSDTEALSWAITNYAHLSFNELLELNHEEEAYQKAEGGRMRYEDMLEPTADRAGRAMELGENARYAVF
jgi:hypothetical protein